MEELNKIIRAIGSFIFTCIMFGVPIATAFMLHTKHRGELMNFFTFVLLIVSIFEFIAVFGYLYISSEED